jgi:hypothetical protein
MYTAVHNSCTVVVLQRKKKEQDSAEFTQLREDYATCCILSCDYGTL